MSPHKSKSLKPLKADSGNLKYTFIFNSLILALPLSYLAHARRQLGKGVTMAYRATKHRREKNKTRANVDIVRVSKSEWVVLRLEREREKEGEN